MTHTFLPLLLRSSDPRLLFVTSGLSNMEAYAQGYYPGPAPSSNWPVTGEHNSVTYRSSKVALNSMMLTWHWQLKKDGVKVWCISPGFLATGLGGDRELLVKLGAAPAVRGRQADHRCCGGRAGCGCREGSERARRSTILTG